ncbi:MAG TPA: M23 family metallopeptidase [Candidatus Bilophila faecipullorum]|uniref:M23 family metallopeptidase n=1 Tax=Candidatus Bilophila faecipullorum TaxID=2838482 RepID=A0A9D1UB16_9BACT|nr:M23 family metallopeptidase [uncultured Bilophila sp.]HIW79845.1 M23 family metallopeptidase [Candidatus Bilophila faecipullorum]
MIVRTCRAALLPLAVLLASAVWCGGAAAASLTIHAPEEAKQGSAVRVRVAVDEPLPRVAFTWLGKTIDAPTVAEGPDRVAEALLPVPVNASKDLIVQASAGALTGKATVRVLKVKWPEQQISVQKNYVNPPKETLKRIEGERKASAAAIGRVTPERHWRGPFVRPVPGVVTSAFGGKRMFNGEARSYHRGVDLRGAQGTPIKAMADGKVLIAQNMYFAGNTVYLDHGQGVISTYAHMSRLDVKPGESVKAGQQIGLVGATGRVTGPHLHLGVNILGVAVDPLSLVPQH